MHHRTITGTALALVTTVSLQACGSSGGDEPRTVLSTFNPGFALRQDVQLGSGSVSQAHVLDLDGDGPDDFIEADFFDMRIRSAVGNDDGTFSPFFELVTPNTPWALEVGDFDGDGRGDIAVACTATLGGVPSLTVWRGLGDGSYLQTGTANLPVEPYDLAVGRLGGATADSLFVALPDVREVWHFGLSGGALVDRGHLPSTDLFVYAQISVAVVDVDGDGGRDLVVGEFDPFDAAPDRIAAHLWNGASFAAPTVLVPLAFYPLLQNVGDVDGDGFEDLAVPQLESDRALLLLGSASGLAAPLEVALTGPTTSIVFADLDGDGVKDVAGSVTNDDALCVRIADAPLSFGPPVIYNVGGFPRSIATGVFGEGEEVDLFCSNLRDVSVLHGNGDGSFEGARGFPVGDEPQFVRAVDLDDDGNLDAVSIDLFQSKIVFMHGDGAGGFHNVGQVPLDPTTIETPGFLLVRDFDEDGMLDVATSLNSADRVQLVRNQGSLPFSLPVTADGVDVGFEPLGLDSSDLNGDGHMDIVVANAGDETIQVLLGNGDGTFEARGALATPFIPLLPMLGDWDVDGNLDIAVATGDVDGSDTNLVMYRGDGTGHFTYVAQRDLPRFTPILHVADFNEDGRPDLVGSQPNVDADELLVMINTGAFTFDLRPLKVGFRMGTLEVTDANRDGHMDILVPLGHGQLVIALGDGAGNFPTILPPGNEQFPAPRGASTSALADVDNDGLADLLTVSPRNPHLWVALNRGAAFE